MSRSDWGQYFTPGRLVGIILALLVAGVWLVVGWPQRPEFAKHETIRAAQGQYQPNTGQCDPSALLKVRPASKRQAQTDECAKRAEDHRVEQARLAQEVRVTEATEEALRLSYAGSVSSLFQAVLLFLTLAATAWAAFAASEATRHAKASEADVKESIRLSGEVAEASGRMAHHAGETASAARSSASAARNANRLAQENANTQLRAYVHANKAKLRYTSDGHPMFIVKVVNTGQTPASFFEVAGVSGISTVAERKHVEIPKSRDLRFVRWRGLGAGRSLSATVACTDPEQCDLATVRAATGGKLVTLRGIVRYSDIYGQAYESEFSFFTPAATVKPVGEGLSAQWGSKMVSAPGETRMYQKVEKPQEG